MPDYEEIGRYVGRYGSIRLTRSELFPLLNAMYSRDSYKASCESLQAENAALRRIAEAAEAYKVACKQADATWEDADINASRIAQENLFAALEEAAPDTEAGGEQV